MTAPNVSVKILAENLASAALEQVRKDMGKLATAAKTTSTATAATNRSFGDLVRGHLSLARSGDTAKRSLGAAEEGMRALALQATGLSSGVGQLSRALLLFGGGSTLVLGVAGGIAAIAFGFRALGADARATEERIVSLRNRLLQLQRERAPNLAVTQEIEATTNQLREAEARHAAERQRLNFLASERMRAGVFRGQPITQEEAERRVLREGLVPGLGQSQREIATARATLSELRSKLSRTTDEEFAKWRKDMDAVVAEYRNELVRLLLAPENRPGAPRVRGPGRLKPAAGEGPPPMAPLSSQPTTQEALARAVFGLGDLVYASRSGVGGIASFAGGLLTSGVKLGDKALLAASPFLGAVLTVGGGLFRMFDRSAERRHRELVDSIQKTAKLVGLQRVRLVVVNGRGDVIADLREAETHDAVSREPGYEGATG